MNIHTDVSALLTKAAADGERAVITEAYNITDEGEVVPADDVRSAFVLVGKGGSLPRALAEELNLPIQTADTVTNDVVTALSDTQNAFTLQNEQTPVQAENVVTEGVVNNNTALSDTADSLDSVDADDKPRRGRPRAVLTTEGLTN